MNNNKSGKFAEFLAGMLMRCKGYRIISCNYITGKGTHAGEIDLIVVKRKKIVFVEVKKRQNLEKAAYAVSEQQKKRIIKGAQAFLSKHPQYANHDIRFDAILVKLPLSIKHIPNAWLSGF